MGIECIRLRRGGSSQGIRLGMGMGQVCIGRILCPEDSIPVAGNGRFHGSRTLSGGLVSKTRLRKRRETIGE